VPVVLVVAVVALVVVAVVIVVPDVSVIVVDIVSVVIVLLVLVMAVSVDIVVAVSVVTDVSVTLVFASFLQAVPKAAIATMVRRTRMVFFISFPLFLSVFDYERCPDFASSECRAHLLRMSTVSSGK